ncbi:glucosamine-6-phosphate deaminase [Oceanimonas sp. CHS3-5]|uniref:glucosamine-6-phosphate deaminase n=1 Tax=Oceanimonas sp. CHS3-5 TaxID=3068186 RepID=UPI00273D7CEB|nr:glucosamine-6-phosphate deaminase [Oceanimonas sp. CHS3-5]MDP5291419.1 glucosamine-6-phosphate deaminase [Oceanimonas sp. CHS3-5]
MRLLPLADAEQVGRRAARHIASRIRVFAPSAKRPFVLGLPTGSTPLPTYRALIRLYQAGELSFRYVVTFNMDEYVGLPQTHPQRYRAFMHEQLFSHIDIPADHIHLPEGMAGDLQAECHRYEARLAQYGPVRLFLAGVGSNGHLAFNEPGSSPTSRTRVVELTEDTRRANARFFDDDPALVPARALTVGLGTLLDAEEIVLLITGAHKARALQAVTEGPASPQWPVSALQRHPNTLIFCDADATSALHPNTLRHFQQREAERLCCPE